MPQGFSDTQGKTLDGFKPSPLLYFLSTLRLWGLHIMWDCPKVYAFWEKLVDSISPVTKIYFPYDLELHLLNDN